MSESSKKWEASFWRFQGWDTPTQRRVQEREARLVLKWLLELKLSRYDILEIGCGNGYFGRVVAEELLERNIEFTYHFTDLLPQCLEVARKTVGAFPQRHRLSFNTLNVYEADVILGANNQNIVLSTGFASPAAYKDAVPVVSKVLREGGVLICDFINHFSPAVFFSRPLYSISALARYLLGIPSAEYHFGRLGVRRYFARHGLELVRSQTIRLRKNPLVCMFRKREAGW